MVKDSIVRLKELSAKKKSANATRNNAQNAHKATEKRSLPSNQR
jgi:hypothetical protein